MGDTIDPTVPVFIVFSSDPLNLDKDIAKNFPFKSV